MNEKLLDALRIAEAFIADELEQRESSGLPDSDPYIFRAKNALEAVQDVIHTELLAR